MKTTIKFLVLTLLIASANSFLHAQLGLGLRGGVNLAKAELEANNEKTENDYKPGITAALFAEIGFTENFAVQPEVSFIQKGYKATYSNGFVTEVKTTINYIEVPVLLKGKFGSEMVKAQVFAGPIFGYAFDGTWDVDGEKTDIDFDKDEIRQMDIGVTFGVGLEIAAGPGSFFLDGRYGWGFTNLNDGEESDHHHWHNRGINIGLGYIYRFGG